MQTEYVRNRSVLTIHLPEEVDHCCTEQIRREADRIIEKCLVSRVIFDFSKTNFMDSSGIGVIMGRYKIMMLRRGRVEAVNLNRQMQRIFKMSGLEKIIKVIRKEDLEEINGNNKSYGNKI